MKFLKNAFRFLLGAAWWVFKVLLACCAVEALVKHFCKEEQA